MNWLGGIIQKEIDKNDTVLDLGCGIMQATLDTLCIDREYSKRLKCKYIVGVDTYKPYLNSLKDKENVITLLQNIIDLDNFVDKSFDIVMLLDVIEHLDEKDANMVLREMERIARKKIIIYTPTSFDDNEKGVGAYDLGFNKWQRHKCLIKEKTFKDLGYVTKIMPNERNLLAIKEVR